MDLNVGMHAGQPCWATLQGVQLCGESTTAATAWTGTSPVLGDQSSPTNLLSLGGFGAAGLVSSEGVYIGEGLPPVPEKLATKIRAWKFVDMSEMLPEFWWQEAGKDDDTQSRSTTSQPRRRKKVTDITSWLQCYGLYVSVLASHCPEAIPELMAYMITVLRVSQDFEGSSWVTYDSAFRRQAEATGDRKWSWINPSMYSICFAGQARKTTRCDICLSIQHSSTQ